MKCSSASELAQGRSQGGSGARPFQPGHTQLVGNKLHRHGQIQARIGGIGLHHHVMLASSELVIRESTGLATKDKSDLRPPRLELLMGQGGAASSCHHGPGHAPASSRRANHEGRIVNSLREGGDHRGPVHQLHRRGGPKAGFRIGETLGIHQHEVAKAHILQGPGRRPDVSGMGRLHQHEAQPPPKGGIKGGLWNSSLTGVLPD